ncbi:undecaprenyl/decaprenyl-phosphate alpha-N-acetylglucosaminyl 1-phosphate transferase [Aestuariimicrobium sp. p3-SID1156]|uniref:MraY family glycosyltransferase n=1 Tax=Aestuariimicrobium sp. p3-SID1156 TaxID=2916038 RepID=UPI00223B112B|nr:MraY family glycosyltransferase [Aestuariimicrobium sp. p3-SID1156]MCT1459438.1 undecaprenyl/decaprenyl-phosphate alpha-N-acetylglucosaminyl 1-phosphate transferase [Aestuariimicrobium sp. p3-SID1156]
MREYLLVLLTAALTTYLTAGVCRRTALQVGAVAKVRDRDVHAVPIPYFGGVAMFLGLAVAFLLASQLPFLGRLDIVKHDALAVLAASLVICVVGVLDDLLDLSAVVKFAGQMLAAGIVVLQGVRMYWIPLPNSIIALDNATSILVTVLFIVLCANAVNFVDGLDGLAAGVVAIGAGAFFSYTYLLAWEQELARATTASLVTVVATGICLGFLPHNFFPARMFMGDSGSLLLGLLLATSTISLTGQIDPSQLTADGGGLVPSYLPILLPLATLALPLLDLVLAYIRRTIDGRWWFVADKQHLHHRLLELGHSQVRAVLLLYLWTGLLSFGVILVGLRWGSWSLGSLLAGILALLVLTFGPRLRGKSTR